MIAGRTGTSCYDCNCTMAVVVVADTWYGNGLTERSSTRNIINQIKAMIAGMTDGIQSSLIVQRNDGCCGCGGTGRTDTSSINIYYYYHATVLQQQHEHTT